ncbi:MAG: sigma-70 family RNA polymerase sigma factor [Gemmataceae bacterium]
MVVTLPNSNPAQTVRRPASTPGRPGYLFHPDFTSKKAAAVFDPSELLDDPTDYDDKYMPDEVTRDHARRMHYAAHRMSTARSAGELSRWRMAYHALRDRIVLGNRKLVYRAVRRRAGGNPRADDMVGDCHIVLIQAVAVFNPWLGIRFSTYAYTCLIRALSRLSQRMGGDWLNRSLSLDALPDGSPPCRCSAPSPSAVSQIPIEEFLRADHPLLSDREKQILAHRFLTRDDQSPNRTLEQVGRALGLSKERVRQVQATALEKLRQALCP